MFKDLHDDHVNFDIIEIDELDEGDSGLESDDESMV